MNDTLALPPLKMTTFIEFQKTGECKYCGSDLYGCKGRVFCDKDLCIRKYAEELAIKNVRNVFGGKPIINKNALR